MENIEISRKSVKKEGRQASFSVLLYFLIFQAVGVIVSLACLVISKGQNMGMELAQFVSTFPALGFLFLFFARKGVCGKLFKREKKMTVSRLAIVLCAFVAASAIALSGALVIEGGLNCVGLTTDMSYLDELVDMNSPFMILSVWVLAPIGEELIFRGLIMRHLQKHGKLIAIVVPALLFALMHGNIIQGMNAFMLGLVLGYVAIEYSIVWSILLHAFNNIVLATVLPELLGGFAAAPYISYAVAALCVVICVVLLICRRKAIIAWIREHMWEKPKARWILLNVWTILFALMTIASAVMAIKPL